MSGFLFGAGVMLALVIAWVACIGPWFAEFRRVTGVAATLANDPPRHVLAHLALRLRGLKTIVVSYVSAIYLAAAGVAQQLDPEAIAPLRDEAMWRVLFGEGSATKIAAALALAAALLSARGHLAAAKTPPQA